jgi:hypothetical protein
MKAARKWVKFGISSGVAVALVAGTGAARADQVVQVPLGQLLTARTVTTLTQGKLVPWTEGSRGGNKDGFMTAAASKFLNQPATLKTLPDDGMFAADARHPQVRLNFSNDADPMSHQTFWIARTAGTFMFPVPAATYSKMFLFFSSGDATTALTITLGYGAATQVVNVTVPDFFNSPLPTDPVLFNLAPDLPNWYQNGMVYEVAHHNICGVELQPMAGMVLQDIKVDKAVGGFLTFYGATGIATGAVAGDLDGGATTGPDAGIGSTTDGGPADGDVAPASGDADGAPGAGSGTTSASGGTGGASGSGGQSSGSTAGGGSGAGSGRASVSGGVGGASGSGGQYASSSGANGCALARGQPDRHFGAIATALVAAMAARRRRRGKDRQDAKDARRGKSPKSFSLGVPGDPLHPGGSLSDGAFGAR